MTVPEQPTGQGGRVCQRGGCGKPAVETCAAITLHGNECVRATCADHRCPCADGIKAPIEETSE